MKDKLTYSSSSLENDRNENVIKRFTSPESIKSYCLLIILLRFKTDSRN